MTISFNPEKSSAQGVEPAPRAVSLKYAESYGGRLPVIVTVVPTADLDVRGGVFVDLHPGTRGSEFTTHAAAADDQEMVSHQIGKAMKLTVGQSESFRADVALPKAHKDTSLAWYVRGRFAALSGGEDLSSAWLEV